MCPREISHLVALLRETVEQLEETQDLRSTDTRLIKLKRRVEVQAFK